MNTAAPALSRIRYELRRVAQTRRSFTNWPVVLGRMAGERLHRGAGDLEFATRSGVRLTCPNVPGARLPVYEQYADDCYRLRDLLAPLQGRPLHVLDIGAHVGSFATHVAALHRQAHVECYEPSRNTVAYLRRNAAQNGVADRITVHEAALSDEEGTALLDDNDLGSVHNGLIRDERRLVEGNDALAERHAAEVVTTTFDRAVAASPAPPQLVKMDCEGGEYALVYASSPESWASVQLVVLEYHPVPGESWDTLRGWFEDVGFAVFRLESGRPGLGTAWLARSNSPIATALERQRFEQSRQHLPFVGPVHRARRLAQTPRAFSNWAPVLRDMALGRLGHGPRTLTFRTRSGARITTPNRPGARVPVYELFAEDSYRLEWLLGSLAGRPINVMDIGGHVGTFSVRLSQVHRTATITAFEPSPATAEYLRRNVAQNDAANRVTVVQRALAGRSGHAVFGDNGAGSGLNALLATGADGGSDGGMDVETISFDDALALAGGEIDLVKIDCEGGEYDLVLNSSPQSWETVQRVVIEHHPVPGHSWPELQAFFTAVGLEEQDEDFVGRHGCVWLSREPLGPPA